MSQRKKGMMVSARQAGEGDFSYRSGSARDHQATQLHDGVQALGACRGRPGKRRRGDRRGAVATIHPANPNGSVDAITGLTTPDGRFTILMPHPERVFRTVQMSWSPGVPGGVAGEDLPSMRMFRNCRRWVD